MENWLCTVSLVPVLYFAGFAGFVDCAAIVLARKGKLTRAKDQAGLLRNSSIQFPCQILTAGGRKRHYLICMEGIESPGLFFAMQTHLISVMIPGRVMQL